MVSLEVFVDRADPRATGSAYPVTEMNTRNISCGVKASSA